MTHAHYYTAPSSWASYLINGDASGLEDWERALADRFAARAVGECVSAEDAGFNAWHDARNWGIFGLAADCQTYTFLAPGMECHCK